MSDEKAAAPKLGTSEGGPARASQLGLDMPAREGQIVMMNFRRIRFRISDLKSGVRNQKFFRQFFESSAVNSDKFDISKSNGFGFWAAGFRVNLKFKIQNLKSE